jgi:hypothetical protein
MEKYIHTSVRAEVTPPVFHRPRGVRLWRSAEISSSVWFLVEACVDQRENIEVRQFVTTDVCEAFQIEFSMRSCRWSRVRIFMRFEELSKEPLIHLDLDEAHRCRNTGAHQYKLLTGHLIREPGSRLCELDGKSKKQDWELVYRSRGAASELHSLPTP